MESSIEMPAAAPQVLSLLNAEKWKGSAKLQSYNNVQRLSGAVAAARLADL